MRQKSSGRESRNTAYVMLDTHKCTACWECITACPKEVIGRIHMLWHKHARFINSPECSGCLKCVRICTANAISKRPEQVR